MAQSQLTLGYWGARGACQPLKNLASYLNFSFSEKVYEDRDEWFQKDKPNLNTPFPNLPYLIDGDKVITETEAIALYLAFKANRKDLLGETPEERIRLAQLRGVFIDFRKAFVFDVVYNKSQPDVFQAFKEKALPKLALLSKHLGKNEFIIGKLCFLDFFIAEALAHIRIQEGDWLESVPNLKDYLERVQNLPGLKEYLASGKVPKVFMNPNYTHEKIKN